MRDYTTNNYCKFLWINDLLELKQTSKYNFTFETWKNGKTRQITLCNVIIFGTIVEVKQVGSMGYLYHVDDGTGVIPCKHSTQQFEEMISMIENEQCELLNRSFRCGDHQMYDNSADDSIFNDRSIQADEIDLNKRNRLMGLQSIWEDLYLSFNSLVEQYNIGDSVVIQGKLYSYFNKNQMYINNIRRMGFAEEIAKVAIKLGEGCDRLRESQITRKRLSGLMTFDCIQNLNPKYPNPRNIKAPEMKDIQEEVQVVTPNLQSTITFDTFSSKI